MQLFIAFAGRKMLTAAACVLGTWAVSLPFLDCNPSIYWYDRLHLVNHGYLANKRVWILGASSGIGEELVYQLAASGCATIIMSSRSPDKLQAVARRCKQNHPQCECQILPLDVTDTDNMSKVVAKLPELDLVFLNAGQGHLSPALQTSPETVQSMISTNAIWPMIVTPYLLRKQPLRPPHLVVTSSIAGKLPVPLSAAYAASKFALHGYFSSLQCERPDLRIDLMCPGPVDTDFHGQNNNVNIAKKSSPFKLSVTRCVQIMLAGTCQPGGNKEVWIARPPTLFALYIHQLAPSFFQRVVLSRVGPRRIRMWEQGLDLYDPDSWTRANQRK